MESVSLTTAMAVSSLLALAPPPAFDDQRQDYVLPAIAGQWQPQVQGKTCQERYNFGPNGALIAMSNQKRTTGEYAFHYVDGSDLPVLATKTLIDYGGVDCLGDQSDRTGTTFATFVKLDDKHNPMQMQWCNDIQASQCSVHLRRLLP